MTDTTPPTMESEATPNPIEMFWDRHRKTVITAVVLFGLALAAYEGIKYWKNQQRDASMSAFAVSTGLSEGYGDMIDNVKEQGFDALLADAEAADAKRQPWLLFLAARAGAHSDDSEVQAKALGILDRLESDYPNHQLVVKTDYPIQNRPAVKVDEDPTKPKPTRPEDPELEPAVAGSMVGSLRTMIQEGQAFDAKHAALFEETPVPEGSPRIAIKFSSMDNPVIVALFADKAPLHVANLLDYIQNPRSPKEPEEDGPGEPDENENPDEPEEPKLFYPGLRVHEIVREGENASPGRNTTPTTLAFGLPATRDDDRTKWVAAGASSDTILDFEDTGLSHFPGSLAAIAEFDEGLNKSSGERLILYASDAPTRDGSEVVFGRVVEGLDELKQMILDTELDTEQANQSGRGKPQTNMSIESIEVVSS